MRERGGAKEMDNKWNTPSPFAPAERWGQTDTPQPYQKEKSCVKLSLADGKRGAARAAEERQSGSSVGGRQTVEERMSLRCMRGFGSRVVMAIQRWAALLLAGLDLRKNSGL